MAKPTIANSLGKLRGHVGAAKKLAVADAKQRRDAEATPKSIILNKRDAQGEYDVARALTTTLGGTHREITHEDLATFRHNMRQLQGRITGTGLTARQIMDLAAGNPLKNVDGRDDLELAKKQIRMAVPASATNAEVRFITNAGPDSKDARHHVLVRFLGFADVARQMMTTPTSGDKSTKAITPMQGANKLRKQRLAFDCDCGRHRYFLRYVAEIGGFNAGRKELGYPKIRNPGLKGVACKHVLRVMSEIESSTLVLSFLTRHLEKVLSSADNRSTHQHSQKDAEAMAAKQAAKPRAIKTSEDRLRQRDAIILKEVVRAAKPPKKLAAGTRKAQALADAGNGETILKMLGLQGLSNKDKADLIEALHKSLRK